MQCPKDHGELKKVSQKGVDVYECEECRGRWFSEEDLRVAKDNADPDLVWLDFNLFAEAEGKYHTSESNRKCPLCGLHMHAKKYADSQVTIDVCSDGHGVWLDEEEFQKILKHLQHVAVSQSSSEYAKDLAEELKEIVTGPESKASELRDLIAVSRLYEMRLAAEQPWLQSFLTTYYSLTPFK